MTLFAVELGTITGAFDTVDAMTTGTGVAVGVSVEDVIDGEVIVGEKEVSDDDTG